MPRSHTSSSEMSGLATSIAALPPADGAQVAAFISAGLGPELSPIDPPGILLPGQVECFRRAVAAVTRHRGSLIAEPAGSGKTWIGLAVALALEGAAACVVPSVLREQWHRVATRARVPSTITTHEQWSRGPRDPGPGLVLIDESHRFRGDNLRRTHHLATHLVGRRGVLLSATPVVNRLGDLTNQLLLLVRDDALAPFGVASLRTAFRSDHAPPALAELIVAGSLDRTDQPRRAVVDLAPDRRMRTRARTRVRLVDRLRLSMDQSVRGLLQVVLLQAAASGEAAFRTALGRYRTLLLHHRDALASGRGMSREDLRRAMSDEPDQLIFWPLLGPSHEPSDLALEDLPVLERALRNRNATGHMPDPKVERLRDILHQGPPTVVFAGAQATIHQLRRALRPASRVAWCTGSEAGFGNSRLPRSTVLRWFGPTRADSPHAPWVLLTTDLAAEGLDLQHAGRIVHYDMPWTPARLEQREGRARRHGSVHPTVEVVRFGIPACLDRRLGIVAALRRKRELPARLGLGQEVEPAWTWGRSMARRYGRRDAGGGIAAGTHRHFRMLVGAQLWAGTVSLARIALVRTSRGTWLDSAAALEEALAFAAHAVPLAPHQREHARLAATIWSGVRPLVRYAAGMLWGMPERGGVDRPAAAKLEALATLAARRRDAATVSLAGRGLALLARGHTLGERLLVGTLGRSTPQELAALLSSLPESPPPVPPLHVQVGGIVVFRQPDG